MDYQQAIQVAQANEEEVVPTVCGMCGPGGPGGGCGIYAFVKDGRFTKVAGMDESPVNRGAVCAKGHAAPQWVYSPDRLTYPLKRAGKKGEGKFEKISWDAAIEIIADVLTRQKEKYQKTFSCPSPVLGKPPFLAQGKVALYNTAFENAGFNPMPEWREPPESPSATPELAQRYPLILSDYHTSKNFSASWQRNVPHLREIQPEPTLHIHPEAASARSIEENDWVAVRSPHGWMKAKAEIYPGIRPDTVMILHGWWQGCQELGLEDYPLSDGGANVNNMYSVDPEKAYDPLITAMASQTLVQVEKWAAS